MSSKLVYDEIKTALAAITNTTVLDWESLTDLIEQPPVGEDLLYALDEADSDEMLDSVGSPSKNWMREEGSLDIHIFGTARFGYDAIRTAAETVRDGMRYRVLPQKVETLICTPPVQGLIADGLWSSMIVTVGYRYRYAVPTHVP